MRIRKLKGGALQLTLFISVVIAILLFAFITLIRTHKHFNNQSNLAVETIKNANKGIDYLLQNPIHTKDTILVNLEDEDYKTLKVHKDYWGVFEKLSALSIIKNHAFTKIALAGATQPKTDRLALYLKENNKPLVVVGSTKIQGDAYLPKRGVRTGNISGHSYYGKQLIYGTKKVSSRFPKLPLEILKHIKGIQSVEKLESNQFLDISKNRMHKNSFSDPLEIVFSESNINLNNITFTGHILVQSLTKITVDPSAHLNDVILIAPEIEIKDKVKGIFQAIASKSINLGRDCQLNYPSALVLSEDNSSDALDNHSIRINSGTTIKGCIVYLRNPRPNNFKPQIVSKKDVKLIGELYCQGNLELSGAVHGTVFTNSFLTKASGSIYQNHLYDASIEIDKLSIKYVGLPITDTNKSVAKWLY